LLLLGVYIIQTYTKYVAEFKLFHSYHKIGRKSLHKEENAMPQNGVRHMFVLLGINSLQLLSSSYQAIKFPCFSSLSMQNMQW
jgi:hypothetical protein